jgi:hypothetical protein
MVARAAFMHFNQIALKSALKFFVDIQEEGKVLFNPSDDDYSPKQSQQPTLKPSLFSPRKNEQIVPLGHSAFSK